MKEIAFDYVLQAMETFYPEISNRFSEGELESNFEIAKIYFEISRPDIDEKILPKVLALKTLSLLFLPENANMNAQRIKDVEVRYYQGAGKNKWDMLLDALLDGDDALFGKLRYIGM